MAATPPNQPSDTPPFPDPHLAKSMDWVMPLWLICFMLVVVFGIVSYLLGWWFPRG
jgi:hypothetical protein